tara:strand:- start:77 stop:262 length:186 start_codon:yes stop_codon:yes gene_type:complete
MTKKQRAEAVTQFLSNRLKEAANNFHKKDYEDEDKKSEDLAKVIVIRDLLKELNDKENGTK